MSVFYNSSINKNYIKKAPDPLEFLRTSFIQYLMISMKHLNASRNTYEWILVGYKRLNWFSFLS